MKSFTSRRFRSIYASLPEDVKLRAKRAYRLFQRNPAHPGLNFKKVDDQNDVRAVELDGHPFFVATLFQPEMRSGASPIVDAFVKCCAKRKQGLATKVAS